MTELINRVNPLDEFRTYQVKHILVAFEYTDDAIATPLTPSIGICGEQIVGESCGGMGIVLVNEFSDPSFSVIDAEMTWNYYAPNSIKTSSYAGYINVTDRTGMLFADRLTAYATQMGMSIHHLSIAWKTIFTGEGLRGEALTFEPNPLIFHITKFAQSLHGIVQRSYNMEFVAAYNTHGLSPQFSKMYQMSVTHKDGNLHKQVPTPEAPTNQLISRREEDRLKATARVNRLDKSKPMRNLGEVCDSLSIDLDEQRFEHKNQLQKILGLIRQEYTNKILPVKQKKGELPLRYSVDLDPIYRDYAIDNRNLPFEQSEQDQRQIGLRILPAALGQDIVDFIDDIMRLSRKVGDDHAGDPAKSYKVTISTNRKCDGKYHINVKIRQYTPPYIVYNGPTTAPGNYNLAGPLEFTFQDPSKQDGDIYSISYASSPEYDLSIMETDDTSDDATVAYANREQPTLERQGSILDFFKRGFSGNRAIRSIYDLIGLESASSANNISKFIDLQQTKYAISIRGNPALLNDLNRSPADVVSDLSQWQYLIYDQVETHPMYIKLKVYLQADSILGGVVPQNIPNNYYFEDYLHMYKIVNRFDASLFTQDLYCMRTDEAV